MQLRRSPQPTINQDVSSCLPSSPSPTAQVCTSELGAAAKLQEEFKKRGVKLVALSCNDLESHKQVGGEVLVGVAGARACGAQAAPRYYQ